MSSVYGLSVSCIGKRLKYVSEEIDDAVTSDVDQDLGVTKKRILQCQWRVSAPSRNVSRSCLPASANIMADAMWR